MSGIPAGAGSLLGKRLGKYEILALLALGGTAEIYLARIGGAAGFEKYVVVKCLHDHLADDTDFVKMFLDEARLAAHLDHSNIVQTMELGEHENRYYMVMEFLAGLSLAMVVRRAGERLQGGRIPIPLVLNMLAQACAGLHYAHEKAANGKALNIVHRDISPQNLVVSFEGVVKVVDFGIAKAEMRETRTRSGTIKGKFAYMSPEQCVANNVDRRTDVFALGVIAHELLTGRRLFKKPSPYETYQAVIECNVAAPSKINVEIDPALDPIILKACAKDKEGRYPTAEAFGDALLGYLHHRGKGSGPGDVARFFDTSFGQEIEEHGARMRELISGRDVVAESASWGEEDDPDNKRNLTVDLGPKDEKSLSLDSIDLVEAERPSAASLSDVIDDLGQGRSSEDDELPAEKTRIETNPLERIEEMNQVAIQKPAKTGKTPAPQVAPSKPLPSIGSGPTRAPARSPQTATPPKPLPSLSSPQANVMPPSGALPLPPAPSIIGPSGKSMSAAAVAPTAALDMSGLDAETVLQNSSLSPRVASGRFPELANLPTMIADPDDDEAVAETEHAGKPYVDPHGPTNIGQLANMPPINGMPALQRPDPGGQGIVQHGMQQHPSQPMMQPPPMQAPLATSVPINPSAMPRPIQPSSPPPLMDYPVMNTQLRDQIATGATVFPSDQAELMSPVGQHYGEQVDWAAAAAAPAKAIPPWKLILIFVGAIGLALTLTIIVARIIR